MYGPTPSESCADWADVSPTEEQWYNNLSPDLKKRVDEIKAKKAREQSASDRLQQLKVRRAVGKVSDALPASIEDGRGDLAASTIAMIVLSSTLTAYYV